MKIKHLTIDIICFLLVLYFFYEGIFKLFYLHKYGVWLNYTPLLKHHAYIAKLGIPLFEVCLSLSFFIPKFRITALYLSILGQMIFCFYIIYYCMIKEYFFLPFHGTLGHPNWLSKLIICIIASWLAFMAIILSDKAPHMKWHFLKTLRNKPAS